MPRCGSTSIVHACDRLNISSYGGRLMGFWGDGALVKKKYSDNLCECVKNYVGTDVYDKSYKFTTVRNPYARAVSIFHHPSWKSVGTFNQFCIDLINNNYPNQCAEFHSTRLTEHLVVDNQLQVDRILRLEDIQDQFNDLCTMLGEPRMRLIHANKTDVKPYSDYYDGETYDIITEKYINDINTFNYSFK